MSDTEPRTVYANSDQSQFYWIPDAAKLPAGPLKLRSLKGDRKDVDPAAAAAYEIPEDQAKAIVAEDLKQIARRAQDFLVGAAGLLRAAAKPVTTAVKEQQQKSEMNFASALGMTPDEVREDPDKALDALKTTLTGLANTLRDRLQENDTEARANAEDRIRAVAGKWKDIAGEEYTGPIEEFPEKLRAYLANPELAKQIEDAAKRLRELAAELRAESIRTEPQ